MVENMRRKGDAEGADTWLRIIVAIDDLGTKRLVLAVLFTAALAACKTQPSPWSPEVDKLYHQMYGPIIDGG